MGQLAVWTEGETYGRRRREEWRREGVGNSQGDKKAKQTMKIGEQRDESDLPYL